jgi:hypothetical protein
VKLAWGILFSLTTIPQSAVSTEKFVDISPLKCHTKWKRSIYEQSGVRIVSHLVQETSNTSDILNAKNSRIYNLDHPHEESSPLSPFFGKDELGMHRRYLINSRVSLYLPHLPHFLGKMGKHLLYFTILGAGFIIPLRG